MCNIVTEFYLYSIVYIYLINSRLDVTNSVRHHFRTYKLYQMICLTIRNKRKTIDRNRYKLDKNRNRGLYTFQDLNFTLRGLNYLYSLVVVLLCYIAVAKDSFEFDFSTALPWAHPFFLSVENIFCFRYILKG